MCIHLNRLRKYSAAKKDVPVKTALLGGLPSQLRTLERQNEPFGGEKERKERQGWK